MIKRKVKFIVKAILVAIIILSIATTLWLRCFRNWVIEPDDLISSSNNNNELSDKSNQIQTEYILTPEIVRCINKEECDLDSALRNKNIIVSGTVLKKDLDIDKTPYVTLQVGEIVNIGCYLKQIHSKIRKGDSVTIKGIYRQHLFECIVITDAEIY